MQTFIIGITGGVGRPVARKLRARGDDVAGLIRRPEQSAGLAEFGADGRIGDLTKVSAVTPPFLASSLDILSQLVHAPEWISAFDIRAENFHRWRKEHESVVGVDHNSGNATDLYDENGRFTGRAVHSQSRPHTVSDGLTERTTLYAGSGVRSVAASTEAILNENAEYGPASDRKRVHPRHRSRRHNQGDNATHVNTTGGPGPTQVAEQAAVESTSSQSAKRVATFW
jgi:hypothetical protein